MGKNKGIDEQRQVFSLRLSTSQRKYLDECKEIIEAKGYKVTLSWIVLKLMEFGQEEFTAEWLKHPRRPESKYLKGRKKRGKKSNL